MGHEKAIASGKEHRKQYHGTKLFDKTCRNHGSCPSCQMKRVFKHKRQEPAADDSYDYGEGNENDSQ